MSFSKVLHELSRSGENFLYAGGILALAVLGFVLMVASSRDDAEERTGTFGPLVAGFAFVAVNIVAFVAALTVDPFLLFDSSYLLAITAALPLLAIVPVVLIDARRRRPGRGDVGGFVLFVLSVAAAHLWVVAQANASV